MKNEINELGHMTKLAAMTIHGKYHLKSSFPEPIVRLLCKLMVTSNTHYKYFSECCNEC